MLILTLVWQHCHMPKAFTLQVSVRARQQRRREREQEREPAERQVWWVSEHPWGRSHPWPSEGKLCEDFQAKSNQTDNRRVEERGADTRPRESGQAQARASTSWTFLQQEPRIPRQFVGEFRVSRLCHSGITVHRILQRGEPVCASVSVWVPYPQWPVLL